MICPYCGDEIHGKFKRQNGELSISYYPEKDGEWSFCYNCGMVKNNEQPKEKIEKLCTNCLMYDIRELLGLEGEFDAADKLTLFYCICCADCSIPSMEHNWTENFPRKRQQAHLKRTI